jgi:hypothetical protein
MIAVWPARACESRGVALFEHEQRAERIEGQDLADTPDLTRSTKGLYRGLSNADNRWLSRGFWEGANTQRVAGRRKEDLGSEIWRTG